MKVNKVLAIFLAVALFFPLVSEGKSKHVRLTVYVSSKDTGLPIRHARVEIVEAKRHKNTSRHGLVIFNIDPGKYTIWVVGSEKDAYVYKAFTGTIDLKKNYAYEVELEYPNNDNGGGGGNGTTTGDLSVIVFDQNQNRLSGAQVTVGSKNATTNSNGVAVFNGLNAGDYALSASLGGYNNANDNISVSADESVTFYIMMFSN